MVSLQTVGILAMGYIAIALLVFAISLFVRTEFDRDGGILLNDQDFMDSFMRGLFWFWFFYIILVLFAIKRFKKRN